MATRTGNPEVSHSNSLLRDINDCLEESGLSLRDVDVFACASGPGSFTGLRIGIATLKALAATCGRSCAGVPTLQAVAHAAGPSNATVSLLPAGRGEVFAQMLSVSDDFAVTEVDAAAHLSPQRLVEKYGELTDLTWAGDGAHLRSELLRNFAAEKRIAFRETSTNVNGERGWKLAAKTENLAKHVAALALKMTQSGKLQSPESLHAIYVRPSDAELKELCR